ncbi:hypothetical protein WICPIJ_001958 [Wickerhamomyces pijperi]|uniref:Secreted protein n=1 Tax=Wickerhamomyces pijperi TaxID=599730 RepID=A0A9P8QCB5_WICPI|nr:hypothetical protein WICPIJ_001958 [Wickerhamomyces pijperi]
MHPSLMKPSTYLSIILVLHAVCGFSYQFLSETSLLEFNTTLAKCNDITNTTFLAVFSFDEGYLAHYIGEPEDRSDAEDLMFECMENSGLWVHMVESLSDEAEVGSYYDRFIIDPNDPRVTDIPQDLPPSCVPTNMTLNKRLANVHFSFQQKLCGAEGACIFVTRWSGIRFNQACQTWSLSSNYNTYNNAGCCTSKSYQYWHHSCNKLQLSQS